MLTLFNQCQPCVADLPVRLIFDISARRQNPKQRDWGALVVQLDVKDRAILPRRCICTTSRPELIDPSDWQKDRRPRPSRAPCISCYPQPQGFVAEIWRCSRW